MSDLATKPSIGSTLPSVKYPVLLTVLQQIADGATPSRACADNGMTLASLKYHLKHDDELKALFDDALETGSDALADMLVNIDQVHSNPAMANVISKNVQWLLERRKPEKYGARLEISTGNRATTALIAALDAAIHRIPTPNVPALPARVVVDLEAEVVERTKKEATPVRSAPPEVPSDTDAEILRQLGL